MSNKLLLNYLSVIIKYMHKYDMDCTITLNSVTL